MTDKSLLTPELLRQLLQYDPETGNFAWRERPVDLFDSARTARLWNARWAGKPAFTAKHSQGYHHGAIFAVTVFAHRIAWAMTYGSWPSGVIDHINGDRSDNRIANLRDVTHAQNLCNRSKTVANTSGFKGVSWDQRSKKWAAWIKAEGKQQYLGKFDSREAAHAAYVAACERFHGEYGRTA